MKTTRFNLFAAGVIAVTLATPTARAATRTWSNAAGGDFNTAANWGGTAPVAADTGVFNSALAGNVTLAANAAPTNLSFDTNASSFTLGAPGGFTLSPSNGGSLSVQTTLTGANKTFTVNAPLVLTPGSGTTAGSGTLQNNAPDATNTLVSAGGISSATTTNTETLTLGGTNPGGNLISGAISNGGATTFALVKAGTGLWNLTANNTLNGTTTVGNTNGPGGTLQLSGIAGKLSATTNVYLQPGATFIDGDTVTAANNNGVTDRINSAATLTPSGGTFQLAAAEDGFAHSQAFTMLTLSGGAVTTLNTNAATGTNTLSFIGPAATVYSRQNGAQLNIDTQAGFNVAFTNAITGTGISGAGTDAILNGATLNGTDFIRNAAGNVGVATYTATGTTTWTAGKNMDVTDSNATAYAAASVNSARFNVAAANTLTLTGVHTLPNILVTAAVGNNLTKITGGSILGQYAKTLDIFQNNTSNGLTIESAIADSNGTRLSKGGLGLVTLAGANTYTQVTYVNQGPLLLTGSLVNNGSIVVALGATFTESATGVISGTNGLTLNGNTSLSGANTFTGTIALNAGTLELNHANALGNTASLNIGSSIGNSAIVNTTASAITQASNPTVALAGNFSIGTGTGTSSDLNLGTGAVNLVTNRVITLNGAGALTLGGLMTNTNGTNTSGLTVNNGTGTTATTALNLPGGIALGNNTGNNGVNLSGSANINVSGPISTGTGTGTLRTFSYNGTGVLTLSGNNTYAGNTSLNSGTVNINSPTALGTTTSAIGLSSAIDNTSGSPITLTANQPISLNAANLVFSTAAGTTANSLNLGTGAVNLPTNRIVTLNGTGALTFGGLMTNTNGIYSSNIMVNNGTATAATTALNFTGGIELGNSTANNGTSFSGSANVNVGGTISNGPGTVTGGTNRTFGYGGTGVLTVTGNNTYSGATSISTGVMNIQHSNALGTTAGGTTVNSGALQLQGDITVGAEALSLNGSGISNTGSLRNLSGNNTWGGPISCVNGLFYADAGSTLNLTGLVTSVVNTISIKGAGNLNISGNITGTRLDVGYGDLSFTGTLTLSGDNSGLNNAAFNVFSGMVNLNSPTAAGGSNSTLTFQAAGGIDNTSGAPITLTNNQPVLFANVGSPLTVFSTADGTANNSINLGTGPVSLLNHTFTLNGAGSLTFGGLMTNINPNLAMLVVNNGTTTTTFGAMNIGGLALSNSATNYEVSIGGTGNVNITGAITNGGTATAGKLSKSGSGVLTLSGANTYAGTTNVNTGTLALSGGSQNSPITVNTGAVIQFALAAPTTSTSYLTLTAGSKVSIVGTPTLPSYTLMTTSTINGTPVLETPIGGYELVVDGTALKLNAVSTSNYDSWALAHGVTGGANGDSDNDGISNAVEYALALNFAGSDGAAGSFAGNTLTFTKRADAIANGDVSWVIETSTLLTPGTWTAVATQPAGDTTPTISYLLPTGMAKEFARLRVNLVP